ncbi:tropomyosin beta chain-like [Coccinella septempunctata]|uniref:tropomyosin beta chain-like n=1 Tax=Coccinella septempunctata TaxID=41139 RepID=UPI001D063080|nr:tropomyosin beta chain-like [Coccinella septempunctata]
MAYCISNSPQGNTSEMEKQLVEMEMNIQHLEQKIRIIQKERENLEEYRRMICLPSTCSGPCSVPPCPSGPPCLTPTTPGRGGAATDQQVRELREQYNRLQDDFKSKLVEVANLRAENDKLKIGSKEADDFKRIAEEKMKECDKLMKSLKSENNKFLGSKEQLKEQEQQLAVAKQRFREAQDELEELRSLIQDQKQQLEDYRNKYLEAQQEVEEQRRQIDLMEIENNRVNEQVNLEIQRVKNQFQEKLQELIPLPDILKQTQLKLQDAQQMHLLAERNNEALTRELQVYRDKATALANEMEAVRSDQQMGADEKTNLSKRIDDLEKRCGELLDENIRLQTELSRAEDQSDKYQSQSEAQLHEIAQLMAQTENVREESARQVARIKDRCETVRRSMQTQISDLERQVAQSRALARSAEKDRDDIRQKMQAQINNLNDNFEQAQIRIRSLQEHVNYLKHSYSSVFPGNAGALSDDGAICNC